MGKSTTNIVGSSFYPGATDRIMRLKVGAAVTLRREPDNKYDKNAVAVIIFNMKVGHLSKGFAADMAPLMDSGVPVTARRSPQFPNSCVVEVEWPDGLSGVSATRPVGITPAMKPFFPALDLEEYNG